MPSKFNSISKNYHTKSRRADLFDRRGNNPYCHHPALKQAEKGIREKFYLDRPAAGIPFDNG
ncbi:hypothetical protein [Microcystis aeruginosa]|uniref:Uncharacterized protein n=2 Tax=Microcystis TaxID=1125 RepID=A0A552HF16_MICVR|nr:hypothetical protein [Microcystis aeruginosa]QGZ90527.1 hypothetical protein GQR42_14320 [Microcystis aeruginosa FD4]TRU69790.1 MAG: hypothetical protein EWV77_18065 [Microcystis viridis Mv_BB_P_19951000_S68D]TRU79393.1 MAG: hypothetical protein EWV55_00675 [Microcystis viridis Mv_BB_P_19951000_S69]TRU86325.1 MAG: hypothetical protein EWV46_10470 [Microcystis viridis Mv_BB_P_19951000_S69D]